MNKKEGISEHTRSWRALKQTSKNRVITFQAKKKRIQNMAMYSLYAILGLGFLSMGGVAIYIYNTTPTTLYTGVYSQDVKQIHFKTDGVLTHEWVCRKLGMKDSASLMSVDIHKMDEMLEAEGQVKSATVMRSFPDALIVELSEYKPMFKIMATESGKTKELLVSPEGVVYEGYNYNPVDLRQLLWLSGVKIKKDVNGYMPLGSVPMSAKLVVTARKQAPYLLADWMSIDCRDFDGQTELAWSVIRVKTRRTGELVFIPKDFEQQLFRLDGILANMDIQEYSKIKKIDLSLGDHSAVKLSDSGFRKGTK